MRTCQRRVLLPSLPTLCRRNKSLLLWTKPLNFRRFAMISCRDGTRESLCNDDDDGVLFFGQMCSGAREDNWTRTFHCEVLSAVLASVDAVNLWKHLLPTEFMGCQPCPWSSVTRISG